jgi:hypothetical protein
MGISCRWGGAVLAVAAVLAAAGCGDDKAEPAAAEAPAKAGLACGPGKPGKATGDPATAASSTARSTRPTTPSSG